MSWASRDATETLAAYLDGDARAQDQLVPLIYDDLRELAASHLRGERTGHTLQPTALVHEAYLRLINHDEIDWRGRTHFFAMAAVTMRRVLVDHARIRDAEKRGDGARRKTLKEADAIHWDDPTDVLALDDALTRFEKVKPRAARVVHLRFFSGLSLEETAQVLGVSRQTVVLEWRVARAWLNHDLTKGATEESG